MEVEVTCPDGHVFACNLGAEVAMVSCPRCGERFLVLRDGDLAETIRRLYCDGGDVDSATGDRVYREGERVARFYVVRDGDVGETYELVEYDGRLYVVHGCWEHNWFRCGIARV